jgi:uncharacterized protein (UPF0218 family)
MPTTVVKLPDSLRSELKDPMGPIFTDAESLLQEAGSPLITVGDVVTYHVIEAGNTPALALVDDRTERSAVEDEVADSIAEYDGFDREVHVSNPAAVLTEELLRELRFALEGEKSTILLVDGEEDLAALPVIAAAPIGASVVYGQPGEGMVLVAVDESLQEDMFELFEHMDGDVERVRELLGL